MAGQSWIAFAVAAMLLFGTANVVLKMLVAKIDINTFSPNWIVVVIGVAAIAAITLYVASDGGIKLSNDQLALAGVFIALSACGFILMLKAVSEGKIAIVNSILALSTITVAVLSFLLLGDRFGTKEMAAMVLAVASVLVLVS